jgi:hypothetical protein
MVTGQSVVQVPLKHPNAQAVLAMSPRHPASTEN